MSIALKYAKPPRVPIVPNGCVAYYWGQNDAPSTTLRDISGNRDDGTITTVSDLSNQLTFVTDDYVNIDAVVAPGSPILDDTAGTWEGWFKLTDATPAAITALIAFGATDALEYIQFRIMTDGTLNATLYDAAATQWTVGTDAPATSNNTWVHLAITQDGTAPVLYVNGVAVAQTFTTSTNKTRWFSVCTGLDNGRIGCKNNNSTGNLLFLTGSVDGEVRFYSRALGAAELLANALAGRGSLPTDSTSLVAQYKVNELTGTVLTDSTANADNGTIVGATWHYSNWEKNSRNFWTFKLDGDDYIMLADPLDPRILASLAATTAGTWEGWFKLTDATPADTNDLVSFGDTDANEILHYFITSAGKLRALCIDGGTTQWDFITDAVALSDNTWVHLAITHNATAPVLYVNGVAVAQTFTTSTDKTKWFAACAGLDNGRIGCRIFNGGANGNFLTGSVGGEVRFYSRALSAAELLSHVNRERSLYGV